MGAAPIRGVRDAVATELHLLTNEILFERVAKAIGPERILFLPDPTANDTESTSLPVKLLHRFQSWALGAGDDAASTTGANRIALASLIVEAGLQFDPEQQSGVIEVSYLATDPQVAKDVVDAFLREAEVHHREVFSADPQFAFLKAQGEVAFNACLSANQELAKFRIKHGFYDFDSQMTGLIGEIRALTTKVSQDEDQAEQLQGQLDFLKSALEEVDREEEGKQGSLTPNPAYSQLQADLSSLRTKLFDLIPRTAETAIAFRGRKANLEKLIEDAVKELAKQPQFLPPQETGRRGSLITSYDQIMLSLTAIIVTQDKQKARLQTLKKELLEFRKIEPENSGLVLQASQCEKRTEQFNASLESVGLMSLLDHQELGNLRLLQPGTFSNSKASPRRGKSLTIGAMLGLLAGVVLALARTTTDSRVSRPIDLQRVTKAPVLGVLRDIRLSQAKALGAVSRGVEGKSPFQELIDRLWSRILPEGTPADQMTIAFVGDEAGVGCSTVAAAAGLGLALRTRQPVLVIETDFDQPGLARCFNLKEAPGLSEVLAGQAELRDAIQETGIPGLAVLGAGAGPRPGPGAFATDATRTVLESASADRQLVVYDLAPMQRDPDSRALLWETDAVVTVSRASRTRKDSAKVLADTIRARGARLLGGVLTRYRSVRPRWLPGPDPDLQET